MRCGRKKFLGKGKGEDVVHQGQAEYESGPFCDVTVLKIPGPGRQQQEDGESWLHSQVWLYREFKATLCYTVRPVLK